MKVICKMYKKCTDEDCQHRLPHKDSGACEPGWCRRGKIFGRRMKVPQCRGCSKEEELVLSY